MLIKVIVVVCGIIVVLDTILWWFLCRIGSDCTKDLDEYDKWK